MKNTVQALKQLSPYSLAILGSILTAFVFTMMFGLMADSVVPNLGLNSTHSPYNDTAGYAYYDIQQILQAGADGIYNVAAIVLISTGLMALATVLAAFGMRRFERFNVGAEKLAGLMKQIGVVVGIYAVVVFGLAVFRMILGYLDEKIVANVGITSSTWITYLSNLTSLGTSVINLITPLLDLGVGLVTLGLVLAAFGYKIEFGGKSSKGDY
ncbi:MAG: hypothetical protein R3250_01170 [Melioribacteraceae bacterium]|nr:hypothetical protein [Melioribacteraceae bacterium]